MSAAPAAFGFLTAAPAKITVNGSVLAANGRALGPATLGLVAGPVSINTAPPAMTTGATLSAPAGTIHVTRVAGTGDVPVDPRDAAALTIISFGHVDIKGGSTRPTALTVSDSGFTGNGGSVFIRSGILTIDAGTINGDNFGANSGGTLSLRGDDQVTLTNSTMVPANRANVQTIARGAVAAGPLASQRGTPLFTTARTCSRKALARATGVRSVDLSAGALIVDSGASFGTIARAAGNAGNVSVVAGGPVTIDTSAGAGSLTAGAGNAGDVSVTARSLSITNSGQIFADSLPGSGNPGQVTINAGNLSVNNNGVISSNTAGRRDGGSITITAENLMMASSGRITSDTGGSGSAGAVSVTVGGQLTIDGSVKVGNVPTEIAADSLTQSTGNAGPVTVKAGTLSIINNRVISSDAFARSGNPGQVTVTAGTLSIAGPGKIESNTSGVGSGGGVAVVTGSMTIAGLGQISNASSGPGRAGKVSVDITGTQPGALTIATNGLVQADTSGAEDAGSVTVRVARGLSIDGIGTDPTNTVTGITSQTNRGSTGVRSSTFGPGDAGSVAVRVAGGLSIDGAGADPNFLTGISSQANKGSTGKAGDVSVIAGTLSLANRGAISTNTDGLGAAGRVTVALAGNAALGGGVLITSATTAGQWRRRPSHRARAAEFERSRERDHCFGDFDDERQCRVGDGGGAADHGHKGRSDRQQPAPVGRSA